MFQIPSTLIKPIEVLSHWADCLRRSTRVSNSSRERNLGIAEVDTVRRSLIAMGATAAAVRIAPKIVTSAHAAGSQHRYPLTGANDRPDLLTQAFQSKPPHSGHYGDGVTDTTGPVQVVLDNLAKTGGGDVYFPRGDYPLNIKITGSNIRIFCENGTVLRPANSKPVIDIRKEADGVDITGPAITGQRKAQEGKRSAPNVTALHCIRIAGKNITIRHFSTKAARQDGVYVKHVADMKATNLTLEDFDMGATSRNPMSIIAARNTVLNRGTIRLDSEYAGNVDVNGGYALFDLEPNNARQKSRGIHFNHVSFINACTKSGTQSIMFGDTHNGSDIYDVSFDHCRFKREGKGRAPAIRVRPKSKRVERLDIKNLDADGRVFIHAAHDGIVTITNSRFDNIVLASRHFSYHVKVGSGCVLKHIRSNAGKLSISGASHVARLLNVMGLQNRDT